MTVYRQNDSSERPVGSWRPWIIAGAALSTLGIFGAHSARERYLNSPIAQTELSGYMSDLPQGMQITTTRLFQSGAPITPNDIAQLRDYPFDALLKKSQELLERRVPHEGWERLINPPDESTRRLMDQSIESFVTPDAITAAIGAPLSEADAALLVKNLGVKAIFYSLFHEPDQLALGVFDSRIPIQIVHAMQAK